MPVTQYYASIALLSNLALGLLVIAVNSRRPANRSFLVVTLSLCVWLAGVIVAYTTRSPLTVASCIRLVSLTGGCWPAAFYLLRVSIIYHRERWRDHLRRSWVWIALAGLFSVFCFTPWFLPEVRLIARPGGGLEPDPLYGPFAKVYFVYVYSSFCLVVGLLILDQFNKKIVGLQKTELQFLLSAFVVVVCSILLNQLLATLTGSRRLSQLAPLRLVLFSLIIAYGITSRGIMNVRATVRLMLSYVLLGVYTSVVCAAAWFALRWVFGSLNIHDEFPLAVCSGVASAMLINSTATPLRRVTKKILPSPDVDFETTMASVAHIVQTVTTFGALLERFSTVLRKAVGVPSVDVFLLEPDGFHKHESHGGKTQFVPAADALFSQVCADGGGTSPARTCTAAPPGPSGTR